MPTKNNNNKNKKAEIQKFEIKPKSPLANKVTLQKILEAQGMQEQLNAVAGKYMTMERLCKVALLAINRNPDLYKCTQASIIDSIIKAGELGLDFGGQTGQGYLVPYKSRNLPQGVKRCQFIPGYQGFIELAYRSGKISYIDAQLVYSNDEFVCNLGSTPYIKHIPTIDPDRGRIICAYMVAYLKESVHPKLEFMTWVELDRIKSRSKSKDGPWQTDEPEMHRKSVVRRGWKYLPKTPEMQAALEADNEDFENGVPEPSLGPEVPSRDQRKEAEDVVVKDTAEVTRGELQKCLDTLIRYVESPAGLDREIDAPGPLLNEIFAKFAALIFEGEYEHYRNADAYNLENLAQIQAHIEEEGVPQSILSLFPVTAEEAKEHLDEKLEEYEYLCLKCDQQFDEPKKGSGGVRLCPRCLTKEIEHFTPKKVRTE